MTLGFALRAFVGVLSNLQAPRLPRSANVFSSGVSKKACLSLTIPTAAMYVATSSGALLGRTCLDLVATTTTTQCHRTPFV